MVGITVSAVRTSLIPLAAGLLTFCNLNADDTSDAASRTLASISKAYNVQIVIIKEQLVTKVAGNVVRGASVAPANLVQFTRQFAPEFSLYPQMLVAKAGLRRIVLCEHLSYGAHDWPMFADYERSDIFMDLGCPMDGMWYVCAGIHHEFFHLIDHRMGRDLLDDRWTTLNRKNFQYGTKSTREYEKYSALLPTEEYPGFMSLYSTSALPEDKAEVFANIIVDPIGVEKKTKKDLVLRAKVQRMKELMSEFCPNVNEEFWEKARKVRRPTLFRSKTPVMPRDSEE